MNDAVFLDLNQQGVGGVEFKGGSNLGSGCEGQAKLVPGSDKNHRNKMLKFHLLSPLLRKMHENCPKTCDGGG